MGKRATFAAVLGLAAAAPATAPRAAQIQVSYDTYAAGMHVADVSAGFALGTRGYQVQLDYHTTGLVGFFYRGHQVNTVHGFWRDGVPGPSEFFGDGYWRGEHRVTLLDYVRGQPVIRDLEPPDETERQPVPPSMRQNTIDTLSALAELMDHVAAGGRCETTVHTYDGRRVTEISARTVGMRVLSPTGRSRFSGQALQCDFEGRMLAGFMTGDTAAAERPLHGSAWLAQVIAHAPPVPVQMTFQTRWFGNATMYLTHAAPGLLHVAPETAGGQGQAGSR